MKGSLARGRERCVRKASRLGEGMAVGKRVAHGPCGEEMVTGLAGTQR